MGVMGVALADNKILCIDLNEKWTPLRNVSPTDWESQEKHTRLGLTYSQFRQAVSDTGDAGPVILAVPYFKENVAKGIAVLDAPAAMGPILRDSQAAELLWSLAEFVLE
jgi:hypothetical protein